MQQLLQWDTDTFLWFNHLGSTVWDRFWLFMSDKKSWIPLYIFLTYYVYRVFGWKKTLILLITVAVMIAFSDQICNLFKDTWVKRLRPCRDPNLSEYVRLVKPTCGGKYGYFSAHAANHFALAIFMGNLFYYRNKWLLTVLVVWAGIIALSRVYLGVHYPLDVISGAVFGALTGYAFYKIYVRMVRNIH